MKCQICNYNEKLVPTTGIYKANCSQCNDNLTICVNCYYHRDKTHEKNKYSYSSILDIICNKCKRNIKIDIINEM